MIAPAGPSFALLQSRTAVEVAALSPSGPADASDEPVAPTFAPPSSGEASAAAPARDTLPPAQPAVGAPPATALRGPAPDAFAAPPSVARSDVPPPGEAFLARPLAGGLTLVGLRAPASAAPAEPFALGPTPASSQPLLQAAQAEVADHGTRPRAEEPSATRRAPERMAASGRSSAAPSAEPAAQLQGRGGAVPRTVERRAAVEIAEPLMDSRASSADPNAQPPTEGAVVSRSTPERAAASGSPSITPSADRAVDSGRTVFGVSREGAPDPARAATSAQGSQAASVEAGSTHPSAAPDDAIAPKPSKAAPAPTLPGPMPARGAHDGASMPARQGEASPGSSVPHASPMSSEAAREMGDIAPAGTTRVGGGAGTALDRSLPSVAAGRPSSQAGEPGLGSDPGGRAVRAFETAPEAAAQRDPVHTTGRPAQVAGAMAGSASDPARMTLSDRSRASRPERGLVGGDGAAAERSATAARIGGAPSAFEAARAVLPASSIDHRHPDATARPAVQGEPQSRAAGPEGTHERARHDDGLAAGSGDAPRRPSDAAQNVPGAAGPERVGSHPAEEADMTALGEALVAIAGRDWSGGVGTIIPCSIFNAAMIPGWPPPRPFDAPALDAAAARPLPTPRDEELVLSRFAERGGAALGGRLGAMLKRTPTRRRRRILSALAAVMDTIDAVLTALEAELLLASRTGSEEVEDELQTAGLRRRLTA